MKVKTYLERHKQQTKDEEKGDRRPEGGDWAKMIQEVEYCERFFEKEVFFPSHSSIHPQTDGVFLL